MEKSKILDFFDYLKKDKVFAEKFKAIIEKLSTVKNGESAKKILEEELIPFAKSKGYDITYEDFLNFTKSQDPELSDNILEMASGGRSELWNRMGQSLLIFGTGAGLFAGATYGAMGRFGGENSKSAENRSASVQTVDQNRTKSSINNIRKELQDGSKESEINKELGTRAKDDTYASPYSATRFSRKFRNTGARLSKGTNNIVKAKGAYTNKTNNPETKPRTSVNKVSKENKEVKENKKTTEKIKELVKPAAEKPEVEEKNKDKKVSIGKITLPEIANFEKKGDKQKKEYINKYIEVINNKVIRNNTGWMSTIFSLGVYKQLKISKDVNVNKIIEIIDKLVSFKEAAEKFKDEKAEYKEIINKAEKAVKDAVKTALENSKECYEKNLIKIDDADELIKELEKNQEYLNDLQNLVKFAEFKSVIGDLNKSIETLNKKSEGLKKCKKGFEQLKEIDKKDFSKLENLEAIIKDMDKVFDYIGDSVKNGLSGKYTNDIKAKAKNIVEKIKEILSKESTIAQKNGSSKRVKQAYDISKETRKVIEKINDITGSSITGGDGKKSDTLNYVEKFWTDLSNIKGIADACNGNGNINKDVLDEYQKKLSKFSKEHKKSDIIDDVNTALANIQKKLNEKILSETVEVIVQDKSGAYTAENYVAKLESLVTAKSDKDFINLINYCEKNVNDFRKKISTNKVILEYIIVGDENKFKDLRAKFKDTIESSYTNGTFELGEIINFVNKKKVSTDDLKSVMSNLINKRDVKTFEFAEELIKAYKKDKKLVKNLLSEKGFQEFLNLQYNSEGLKKFFEFLNKDEELKNIAAQAGIDKINQKSPEEHKKDIEEILKKNVTNVEELCSALGMLIDSKDYDGVYSLIESAYAFANTGYKIIKKLPFLQSAMSSGDFVTLMNNKKLIDFLTSQSKQGNKGELFNKIKELFNKEDGGIKKYLSTKNAIETVKKLNSLFNPETAEQDEINRLLELGKYSNEELKTLNDKVKNIISSQKDVNEKLKYLNNILSLVAKNNKNQLENILNTNKTELVNFLKRDETKKAQTYAEFKKLFNGTIKNKLGEDKVVELDDVLNYSDSKTNEESKKAKLERDKKLAKSGNFKAIKNRLNDAINKKEYQNVMEIVKAAYGYIGLTYGYYAKDVAEIIENSDLKKYLKDDKNRDEDLYKDFRKYFNETLLKEGKLGKLAEELDAKLNPNLSKDIKRLNDTKDLRNRGKIKDISELLKTRIEEAETDARKLDNVLKIIETVYNDTGVFYNKTFAVGEFTTLIKGNCKGLVEILKKDKGTDSCKDLKTILDAAIKGKWISDEETINKLNNVINPVKNK